MREPNEYARPFGTGPQDTQQPQQDQWEELQTQGDLVTWDQPKTIEGILIGAEQRRTRLGDNTVYSLETMQGGVLAFFGTLQLNNALRMATLGDVIRVKYTGEEIPVAGGGNAIKVFQVWRRKGAGISKHQGARI